LRHEGYFHIAPIRATWKQHCEGRRNYSSQLWAILMFEAWLEEEQRRPAQQCEFKPMDLPHVAEATSAD
jgi:asparagine synthase (glutamine-hydrolysing)